jgi:hypothetical protein
MWMVSGQLAAPTSPGDRPPYCTALQVCQRVRHSSISAPTSCRQKFGQEELAGSRSSPAWPSSSKSVLSAEQKRAALAGKN